ncbi:type II toxin-antitoxin system RelE/ParE family toxin [Marinomonas mediterranea]|jgi:Plasmid stabilization system protein|uniref:Toxin n=1 Tax=Marinomonas mediterranea (strain ATCC 700492 / JCM 21426 / NBRC 103028 / MMB-1) TaxID=717774 RepID=F2JZ47_MARM1|nr:type II toxin-antitoxin system RelE/ParE family toxin [Marinomonas mediterranea]ADZ92025.1 plasmid stabilization system [Marinomonas mediterranea MMB-1]WCN18100.1 type II toxin-antitoxin system RelE/ParE family toxin [Marinomonas mediterranea MMB-1]
MFNISIRPLARQDMLDIWQYTYDTWGTSQADSYIKDMSVSFEMLAESPLLGREAGYIQVGIRLHPYKHYIILYQFTENKLDIVRVLHERMDISRHKLT